MRFDVRALANFEWLDGEGVRHWGQGLTRDISAKGLFIFSTSQPPTQADLQVEVFFGSIVGADTNLQLCAEALVLRVESTSEIGAYSGFALLNRRYKLADYDPMQDLEEQDSKSMPN
jgi:hypothetical protein